MTTPTFLGYTKNILRRAKEIDIQYPFIAKRPMDIAIWEGQNHLHICLPWEGSPEMQAVINRAADHPDVTIIYHILAQPERIRSASSITSRQSNAR